MEVSTLSRRGDRFIPYPRHYSEAFAFSILLYLHRHNDPRGASCSGTSRHFISVAATLPLRKINDLSCVEHPYRLNTFRTSNRIGTVPPFRR